MKRRLNLKSIKAKIIFGFSLVVLLVIIQGIYNYAVMDKANNSAEYITNEELPLLIIDERLNYEISALVATTRGYVLSDGETYRDTFNEHKSLVLEYIESARELGSSADVLDKTTQWITDVERKVLDVFDNGDTELALGNLEKTTPLVRELISSYEGIASERESKIMDIEQNVISSGQTSVVIGNVITILVIIFSIIVALYTSTTITKPIKMVMERMKLIGTGNLTGEALQIKSKDETGQLAMEMNLLQEKLKDMLSHISRASEMIAGHSEELTQSANEVKTGSEQVAITMQELATGSETQANSASDLSSIMGTFTTKVGEANENGQTVHNASDKVINMTNKGTQLMSSSKEQMARIDQIVQESVVKVQGLDVHSQSISKLVSVIQDIAAQTNLLALNAAIEAARAGEHGKGFAVVADEVRKLAEQVSESITDITDLVNNIQTESTKVSDSLQGGYKEVEEGTRQIIETSETFSQINQAVTKMANNIKVVSSNLADIAASSQEMNGFIEEIASVSEEASAGVEETSAASQQISSSMEEVAGSSEELAKLAEELNARVSRFKL
ncbi:methyl-accepting chemotaxis protein [Oceanobacillus arenosus]|uniref:Methyl-accepting chemotaxis protein n=1 Tax=Oceanobacillus arenosus TaxID=1229153 RepID=A0A3D8PQ97_9BACI|nr:methyl-accepting chemotaxis protein [Oceanobacillus arenosus]RDW17369.1 methyl-accepting chemotaxis protein [Oceanobacillus arenosus]